MIFKLITVLFHIVNNAPEGKSAGYISYEPDTFKSEKACVAFMKTKDAAKFFKAAAEFMKANEMAGKPACVDVEKLKAADEASKKKEDEKKGEGAI